MYPEELRYHEGHAWVREDGEELTIGVSQYASEEMGEVIFAELPEEGTEIERDEPYGSIESAKAVEDLIAPVSGTVVRRNEAVIDAPETINDEPYGDGWLIVVRAEEDGGLDSLLTADEYRAHVGAPDAEEDAEEQEEEEEEELEQDEDLGFDDDE
ncbi:MAG: glycine cleavage system protein GcvH [Armatimonadetes bacterium]|nr:glycine cleavage system protein GcvH [Armatimonadota bacterium]